MMIVGEAPGFTEEKLGFPFVGRAGKLLDGALVEAGVRGQPFITNAVDFLPLDGDGKIRKPTQDEIRKQWPRLGKEINLVQPYCILALGATAAWALIQWEGRMGEIRGTLNFTRQKIWPVVVTYHPAYILRGMISRYGGWVEDIRTFRTVVGLGGGK